MAKIYLESTDTDFIIANDNTDVKGTDSLADSVAIASGVTGTVVASSVEQIDLAGAVSDYVFKQGFGENIEVQDTDGNTIFTMTAVAGKAISFTDGTVALAYDGGVMSVGGTAITTTAAAVVPATIDAADVSSVVTTAPVDPEVPQTDTTVKNGDTVEFTFETTETTEVSYTIAGVDAADVVGGADSLTGTATVTDGSATVAVTLRADVDNSAKTIELFLAGVLEDSVEVSTIATNDAVSIGLTEIAIANDAGEYITKDAGNTGSTSYTIASSDSASIDAKVIIGGDANLTVTAQGGDDTIIIDGAGNNVINAGDTDGAGVNANTIILGNGNNIVVVGDGEWNASTVTAGTGINTVAVSGTNTFALNDFTNIQNLIIEDGAIVILDEDLLATFDSIIVNGTTATLEVVAAAGTTTVDLTSVLTGSLASLELADATAVELTTAQITNIAVFDTNATGNIVADEDGTTLVTARGGASTTEVGTVTLEAAMTQDLAETANLSYTMSLTAQELFDQLYLGDANVSAPGTDNDGTAADQILYGATATVTITDTATSAQAVAFDAAGVTFAAAYAVADTAAHLAADVGTGTWLTEDNISSLTITTAATYTQADTIFTAGNALQLAITAAASDADLTLVTPIYDIADTATNVFDNIADTDITDAATVTLTTDATVAEAAAILALDSLTGGYNLADTPAALYSASTAVKTGATDITTTSFETFTVTFATTGHTATETIIFDGISKATSSTTLLSLVNDVAGTTYTNWTVTDSDTTAGTVTFTAKVAGPVTDAVTGNFTGTAIAGNASVSAITVTAQGGASVTQAGKILTYTNTGDTSVDYLQDTSLKLANASTVTLDSATVITLNEGEVLTLAQATKIAPYLADDYVYELADTTANLTSTEGLALINAMTAANTVTPTDAMTLAQYETLVEAATTMFTVYDITDTAANIIDATDDGFVADSLANDTATVANAANIVILNGSANQLTVSDATTIANITAIDTVLTLTVGTDLLYDLSDTSTNLVADISAGDYVDTATEITLTTAATASEASDLEADASYTYIFAIEDTLALIAAEVGDAALVSATTITSTNDTVDAAEAADVATINTAITGATPAKSALSYSISDNYTNLEALTAATVEDLFNAATNVAMVDTAAKIEELAADVAVGGGTADADMFALVDTYAIVEAAAAVAAATYPTYYDNATSITFDDTDLLIADADTAYALVLTDLNTDKLAFSDISDVVANFTGVTGTEADAVALATSASVTDATTVAEANTVAGMVNGTLILEANITDTVANLLTLSTAVLATATGMTATDTATAAQYQTLIEMLQTAEIIVADVTAASVTELIVDVEDTITNVQTSSAEVLSTLGDTTPGASNIISLQAGSELSLTVAQVSTLNLTTVATDEVFDVANTPAEASYEIVDTIENLTDLFADDFDTNGNYTASTGIVSNAATVIISGGTIESDAVVDLEAFVDATTNLDTVNSSFTISATVANLSTNSSLDSAAAIADSVIVTDTANLTQAADILTLTTDVTFESISDTNTANALFTFSTVNGVYTAAYATTAVETAVEKAEYSVSVITDGIDVADAQAIVALLGANATVEYKLDDTPAALAAADASILANATTVDVSGTTTTIEEATTITAGATHTDVNGDLDAVLTYSVTDTAANIAANTTVAVAAAATVQTDLDMATMAEALTIETAFATVAANTKTIKLDVADTATNVVANIAALVAIDDANADENFLITSANDNISLTTTVTAEQAAFLDATYAGEIDTAADVLNSNAAITDGYYLEDTAANLLAATTAYSEADAVVVTDSVNVSVALQIADLSAANTDGTVTQSVAIAKTTFNINDGVEYIIAALAEDNALLGAAASVSIDGTAITLHENRDSSTFHIAGSVAELSALPASLLANSDGYVVIDSLENLTNSDLFTSDNKADHIIVDTAANIAASTLDITGTAEEVRVTDTVDVATLANLQALGLDITTIAAVTDTATALATATLTGGLQAITTVTVTDTTITQAQADAIDGLGDGYVYSLSDTYALLNTDADIIAAQAVTVTNALTSLQAGVIYEKNANLTITVSDLAADIVAGINDDGLGTDAEAAESDALALATTVTISDADITVAEAEALITLAGFDGVYTLNDTAPNLVAAAASVLSNAVEVQVTNTGAATVAEATILTALTNIELDADDLPNFDIDDTATNLSAASAMLLDDVADIDIITDIVVTAAQATALQTLIDNTDVAGLTSADIFDVTDTLANITDAANATAVEASNDLTVSDDITLAQAITVIATNSDANDIIYDLVDTRSNLQGATTAQANFATDITVTDDVTVAQAGIINTAFAGATNDPMFSKITGTMAELTTAIIGQATTVSVTDTMTIDELMTVDGSGFLADAGTKLVDGYDVEDGVDDIINAALNNTYSAAVVNNATTVSLTGSTTMNMAAAGVIMGLNFTGSYDLADTAAEVLAADLATVNGSTSVAITMVADLQEIVNVTTLSTTVSFDLGANAAITDGTTVTLASDVDIITVTAGSIYDVNLIGTTTVNHNQIASDAFNAAFTADDFSIYSGYRTGDGFVVSNTIVEDSLLVWADASNTVENAVVFDTTATLTIDNYLISGAANDTIDLATLTTVDTIVFAGSAAANGVDTVTGFVVASNDTLDFTNFITAGGLIDATDGLIDSTAAAIVAYDGTSVADDSIADGVAIFDDAGTALTTTTLALEFAGGAAFAVDTDQTTKAVVISGDISGANGGTIWYVDASLDGINGISATDIIAVGTISELDIDTIEGDLIA